MSSTDAFPDRESLRANARVNQRRSRRFVVIFLVVFLLFGVLSSLAFRDSGEWSVGEVVVLALPPLVVLLAAAVAVLVWRRRDQDPQLSLGADRMTQRAVLRALRDGGTADPRVDALARDAAERGTRPARLIWLYGLLTVALAAVCISNLVERDWFLAAVFALATVAQAVSVYTFWQNRRRAIRYLEAGRP